VNRVDKKYTSTRFFQIGMSAKAKQLK